MFPKRSRTARKNLRGASTKKHSGKPLRRKSAIRRSSTDPADFDRSELESVWTLFPLCILTGGKADDWHHVFGRGQEFGAYKSNPKREIFSSVLNAAPVNRKDHDTRNLKDPALRLQLYDKILAMVMLAVHEGRYMFTDNDMLFMAFVERYRQNPFQHKLL